MFWAKRITGNWGWGFRVLVAVRVRVHGVHVARYVQTRARVPWTWAVGLVASHRYRARRPATSRAGPGPRGMPGR